MPGETLPTNEATPRGGLCAPRASTPAPLRRGLLLLLLVVLAAALLVRQPLRLPTGTARAWFPGFWGHPVFVLVFALCTLAFVPKPALSAVAGALFGLPMGLLLAVAGTTLGAMIAFILGRRLGRDTIVRLFRFRAWQRLDRQFTDNGFRTVLTLRLIPVLPFAVVNYGAAVSGVSEGRFLAATAFGVVPGVAVYVAAGSTAGTPSPWGWWMSAAALLLMGTLGALRLRGRGRLER